MSAKPERWGALSPIVFVACAHAVDIDGDMASRNVERFDAGAADSAAGLATGGAQNSGGTSTGGTDNTGGVDHAGSTGNAGGSASTMGGAGTMGGSAGATGGNAGDGGPPLVASCDNEIADGLETDTDCGGGACPPCGDGAACEFDADCTGGLCASGHCATDGCSDGELNGDESDVDCGGTECSPCPVGLGCGADSDCTSRQCTAGVCETAVCVAMSGCECADSGSRFYQLCTENKTFTAAQTACQSAGMSLVRVDDASENGFLRTEGTARGLGDFWIGGTDSGAEGTWKWPDGTTFWTGAADGSAIGYANWSAGEPNDFFGQDCAVLLGSGKWDDAACTDSRKFACE